MIGRRNYAERIIIVLRSKGRRIDGFRIFQKILLRENP
jgi:hypothetical protein